MRINHPDDHPSRDEVVSVNELIVDVLNARSNDLRNANVKLDTDISPVASKFDREMLHQAVNAMIEHSLNSMPAGGQLTVTLMNCELHWELEVADSSGVNPVRMMTWSERDQYHANGNADLDRLTEECSEQNDSQLQVAQEIVAEHSGLFQTWDCPQGGTAHVMIIPHRDLLNQKKKIERP